jgi:hypothetical protein
MQALTTPPIATVIKSGSVAEKLNHDFIKMKLYTEVDVLHMKDIV